MVSGRLERPDLLSVSQALYQLSYETEAPSRDTVIVSHKTSSCCSLMKSGWVESNNRTSCHVNRCSLPKSFAAIGPLSYTPRSSYPSGQHYLPSTLAKIQLFIFLMLSKCCGVHCFAVFRGQKEEIGIRLREDRSTDGIQPRVTNRPWG